MKTDNRKIDIDKIVALHSANWRVEQIAEEMGILPEAVKKALCNYAEKLDQKQKCTNELESQPEKIVCLKHSELCEIYEKAAAIGAREALKTFEQERKKEYSHRTDKRLHNTKLLLRNYHMLKEHAEKSVFGRTQMKESALDILESMMSIYNDEVVIQSIKNSATRTAIIVSHIETMFGLYYSYCDKSIKRDIDLRRYNVVWDIYMSEDMLSAKEVAAKYNISKDSVYSDLRVGIERLTALIFGVDGLNVR
ncbi:hypothetical protein [Parablautia intestinalis]|uniref:hypothetical protein n=1 Tax=Parablautia intestinalis TaxID=2320100 RepID=UPI002412DB8E|nr:hypothetical protein [Parablautia intestinalis]